MIKTNEYFDGQVKSLGFEHGGVRHTAGVVMPGRYVFSTEQVEHLSVTLGRLVVRLPGEPEREVKVGETVVIPAGVSFDLHAPQTAAYLCSYH